MMAGEFPASRATWFAFWIVARRQEMSECSRTLFGHERPRDFARTVTFRERTVSVMTEQQAKERIKTAAGRLKAAVESGDTTADEAWAKWEAFEKN